METPPDFFRQNESLAPHTTLHLGGPTRFYAECASHEQLVATLRWAQRSGTPIQILGGGSNTVFADQGFDGLVMKIALQGLDFRVENPYQIARAAAGQQWDELVSRAIQRHLGGIECLSGIPGLVGATPIQNVGAYGQEVSETIAHVEALDRRLLQPVTFSPQDCRFAYRHSRFKDEERERFIITAVSYRLRPLARPTLRYPELERYMGQRVDLAALDNGAPSLEAVRQGVLALRRQKSMVVDLKDPNSRSAGSFFTNPLLSATQLKVMKKRWPGAVPTFPAPAGVKVPAAWLVEQAGFAKGHRHRGAAVSEKHCLALVNRGGTTDDLLALAATIRTKVWHRFGILLEAEPILPRPLPLPQTAA